MREGGPGLMEQELAKEGQLENSPETEAGSETAANTNIGKERKLAPDQEELIKEFSSAEVTPEKVKLDFTELTRGAEAATEFENINKGEYTEADEIAEQFNKAKEASHEAYIAKAKDLPIPERRFMVDSNGNTAQLNREFSVDSQGNTKITERPSKVKSRASTPEEKLAKQQQGKSAQVETTPGQQDQPELNLDVETEPLVKVVPPEAEKAIKDLAKMNQEEFAEYLKSTRLDELLDEGDFIDEGTLERAIYELLTRKPELRHLKKSQLPKLSPEEKAKYDQWGGDHRQNFKSWKGNPGLITSMGDGGTIWESYNLNRGEFSDDAPTYKGYLNFRNIVDDLNPSNFNAFMRALVHADYKGQIKISPEESRVRLRSDNVVMHGITEEDVEIARKVSQEFFGDKASFGTGIDPMEGGSYNELLAKQVLAALKSKPQPTISMETGEKPGPAQEWKESIRENTEKVIGSKISLPEDTELLKALQAKLEEYKDRLQNRGNEVDEASEPFFRLVAKTIILEKLLESGEVSADELFNYLKSGYGPEVDLQEFKNAYGVIEDYVQTGGKNNFGSTGFNYYKPEVTPAPETTEVIPTPATTLEANPDKEEKEAKKPSEELTIDFTQFPGETESKPEQKVSPELNLEGVDNFSQLFAELGKIKSLKGTTETFTPSRLTEIINLVRNNKLDILTVTRAGGLRKKVTELWEAEKDQKRQTLEKLTPESVYAARTENRPYRIKTLNPETGKMEDDATLIRMTKGGVVMIGPKETSADEPLPRYSSIEQVKIWNSGRNLDELFEMIYTVRTFEDLKDEVEIYCNAHGKIHGSHHDFDAKTILDIVAKLRQGDKDVNITHITRSGGLRQKVSDLLRAEQPEPKKPGIFKRWFGRSGK